MFHKNNINKKNEIHEINKEKNTHLKDTNIEIEEKNDFENETNPINTNHFEGEEQKTEFENKTAPKNTNHSERGEFINIDEIFPPKEKRKKIQYPEIIISFSKNFNEKNLNLTNFKKTEIISNVGLISQAISALHEKGIVFVREIPNSIEEVKCLESMAHIVLLDVEIENFRDVSPTSKVENYFAQKGYLRQLILRNNESSNSIQSEVNKLMEVALDNYHLDIISVS